MRTPAKDCKTLAKDGFVVPREHIGTDDIAFLSLDIALRAFYSTYKDIRIWLTDMTAESPDPGFHLDQHHYSDYIEHAAECILHFQHFAELVCRAILRKDNTLLAAAVPLNPVVRHKLLLRESITPEEEQKLYWYNLSDALTSITALVRANRLDSSAGFVQKHIETLTVINDLRNRLWHRGAFMLRYRSLDELIGKHVLPFVLDAVAQPDFDVPYSPRGRPPPKCGIDPVREIVASFSEGRYDPRRIALLKEIGRASYANPLQERDSWFQQERELEVAHAERRAHARANASGNVAGITECPVCGLQTLVGEQDWAERYDAETGLDVSGEPYVFEVECECCTFCLWDSVGAPAELGLSLPDYWTMTTWK